MPNTEQEQLYLQNTKQTPIYQTKCILIDITRIFFLEQNKKIFIFRTQNKALPPPQASYTGNNKHLISKVWF